MPSDNTTLNQAAEYWKAGHALEAGRLIFGNLTIDSRPMWALTILEHVVRRTGNYSSPIMQILQIANTRSEWSRAHHAFSENRRSALKLLEVKARSTEQNLYLAQLSLAEIVAKVIYNATNPTDPFDEDAGCWIAVCLKNFLDLLGDNDFAKSMWMILSRPIK